MGRGVPGVDERDVVGLHLDAGEEGGAGLLAVPGEFEDGPAAVGLVLDGGVLEVADVELANTAVGAGGGEDVAFFGEVDVVDLLVVGDELREDRPLLDVPDRARGVDRAGPDQVLELGVPVERSQRR